MKETIIQDCRKNNNGGSPGNGGSSGNYGGTGTSSGGSSGGGNPSYPPDVPFAQCFIPEGGFTSQEEFMQCQGNFYHEIPIVQLTSLDYIQQFLPSLNRYDISFLENNKEISDGIFYFLIKNYDGVIPIPNVLSHAVSIQNLELIEWGLPQLSKGTITWEQFENWFMGGNLTREYLADGKTINDVNYWNTVNFSPQNTPSFSAFENNFPKRIEVDILSLATELGGEIQIFIEQQYNALKAVGQNFNSCALRLSVALIKSGINISQIDDPSGGNRSITMKDKNGNNYFIRADELDMWMQLTFGTSDGKARFLNQGLTGIIERTTIINNQHRQLVKSNSLKNQVIDRTQAVNFIKKGTVINGTNVVSGIYSLLSENREFATGHIDLMYNNTSIDGGDWYIGNKELKIINIWNF